MFPRCCTPAGSSAGGGWVGSQHGMRLPDGAVFLHSHGKARGRAVQRSVVNCRTCFKVSDVSREEMGELGEERVDGGKCLRSPVCLRSCASGPRDSY